MKFNLSKAQRYCLIPYLHFFFIELSTTVPEYKVTVVKKTCDDALLDSLKMTSLEGQFKVFSLSFPITIHWIFSI